MPILNLADCDLFYRVDDFTDPWTTPEVVLMLHGNAESGEAWYAWTPTLARQYRVVRPDMRGYGRSTPMPREYAWTFDALIDDYCRLMDALGIERFHLVAAKIGGTVARVFAARRPERVQSLTVVGTPQAKRPFPLPMVAHSRAPCVWRATKPWCSWMTFKTWPKSLPITPKRAMW